ncbi:glycoside hydrolase family 3 protein [Halioxenophilus aromaticivorans]|uniref:beta-glucosidase n=1 Tax=Halioxenophilus aromaticivorans TaxID=1306992 RepID=A0AAV3U1D5_9ALTE
MQFKLSKLHMALTSSAIILAGCSEPQNRWSQSEPDGDIRRVVVAGGPTLGYSARSGVSILEIDGLPFKDLNRNGELDTYEDWRLDATTRATSLAAALSKEEIAGLMLYSRHQAIPAPEQGYFAATYSGKPFSESGAAADALSDQQLEFITQSNVRHVLLTSVQSPRVAANWNNNLQQLAEGIGFGIPANNSSDPRHGARKDAEYNAGSGGTISQWPEQLGLSATFEPSITQQFGEIAGQEYRALGITTALSPQIDLATEPRWSRFYGTFGGHPQLATDMAQAYIDGFQTSEGSDEIGGGWGWHSVNTMVKHWPGGGTGEAGRDAHFAFGKFGVYPGNAFETHLKPFVEGAFNLKGKTKMASAVMPYYTISYDQDTAYGENVGNGFSKYIINDLLREQVGYDGVVCTDWLITGDEGASPGDFAGKSWGVETLSIAERHFKVLEAGLDQFGGNNDMQPVLAAFQMLEDKYGADAARARIERSTVRLLKNIFRVGLFENPYLDADTTERTVGQPDFMKAGYDAQLKSLVMIKNADQTLPLAKDKKVVYVPKNSFPETTNFFGFQDPPQEKYLIDRKLLAKDFEVSESPAEADFALVFVKSPVSSGYSKQDRAEGGNGYLPISLQHEDYVAEHGRKNSIAAGDPVVDPEITNRSYQGKTGLSNSRLDLPMLKELRATMGDKPIILVVSVTNPMVFADVEPLVDSIIIEFGVQVSAIADMITGREEPSGLLPMQMPLDMKTVELQLEDVPMDMQPYVDSQGNRYDFAFGLNWAGVIRDKRTERYTK